MVAILALKETEIGASNAPLFDNTGKPFDCVSVQMKKAVSKFALEDQALKRVF